MVVMFANVFIPSLRVRLLKYEADEESVCAPPSSITVPVPATKFEPVPFHAVADVELT